MNSNDLYSSDGKLNFLCSLDLFPTPLIKKCPNATKRWLRAVPNATPTQDIGINAKYDEIDHSPTKIDFIAVSMVDATTEDNLIFSNLPTSDSMNHNEHSSSIKVTSLMNKNEFEFDKEKCIYTFSDQCSMETLTVSIPSYVSNGAISQNTDSGIVIERSDTDKCTLSNILYGKTGNIETSTIPRTSTNHIDLQTRHISFDELPKKNKINEDLQGTGINEIITHETNNTVFVATSTIGKNNNQLSEHASVSRGLTYTFNSMKTGQQNIEAEHISLHEVPKKNKVNRDLQDIVVNEIITQEINQTIFAKATIGKTQGYLSELLRTSKLLEDRSDKEYRRTRHNLEKIRQFLKKPKYERKRIYDGFSNIKNNNIVADKYQDKKKRIILSDNVKTFLCDYFYSHDSKLRHDDFHFLSSHLKLDIQNVKIFYKNWKQRSKIRDR